MKFQWARLPSSPLRDRLNDRSFERSFLVPSTEKKLFQLLYNLQVMLGGQIQKHQILHKSPKTARKILARLKSERKVVEHKLIIGGKEYKLYTLGPAGAAAIRMYYQPNYWLNYSDSEAMQKLMSVDLYFQMCDYLSADLKVLPSDKPYVYTFIHSDKTYRIGVIWDNTVSFLEAYRWEPPRERVILVCQNLAQVDGLLANLDEDAPIRVITREKLREGLIFFKPENGKWVLDIPDKQIRTKHADKVIRKAKVLL